MASRMASFFNPTEFPAYWLFRRVDVHVLDVLVDPPILHVHHTTPLIEPARAVNEEEEVVLVLHVHEVLVAPPVEDVLGVGHVEGVGQLGAADGEGAHGRAFAEELEIAGFPFMIPLAIRLISARPSSYSMQFRLPIFARFSLATMNLVLALSRP